MLKLFSIISVCTGFIFQSSSHRLQTKLAAYIPDGLTKDEWKEIRDRETSKPTNYGVRGPRGYKSRSFESFQRALENGDPKAKNMAMFFAKEKLSKGEIKFEDIPYMQRGGSWDNSDITGAKKVPWTKADRKYDSDQKKQIISNPLTLSDKQMFKKLGAVEKINRSPKVKTRFEKWIDKIRSKF